MVDETCDISELSVSTMATTNEHYSSPSFFKFLALFVNVILQIFISFVAVYMSYMCFKLKFKKTAFHAWFCTIGYCCLMAEGMMSFYEGNILTHPFDNYTKTTSHVVLSAIGGLMGMIGSLQKYLQTKRHFTTFHGKIGLFSSCLCFLSFTSGTASLFHIEPRNGHTVLSTVVFLTGMYAQFTGYETSFFRRKVDLELKLLFKYLIIVIVVLSCIAPFRRIVALIYNNLL